MSGDVDRIVQRLDSTPARDVPRPATPDSREIAIEENEAPSGFGIDGVDAGVLEYCAGLDHSDTDNAERLIRHAGDDLVVLAQDEVPGGTWMSWTGTHWDGAEGIALAWRLASTIGGRIGLEADFLTATKEEREAMEAALDARMALEELEGQIREMDGKPGKEILARKAGFEAVMEAGKEARAALDKRKQARRRFGVSSKNKARIDAMLACAAPRKRRPPDLFNVDKHRVACRSHTLVFRREEDMECPDPDITRYKAEVSADARHHREDWITAALPVEWKGLDASAPKWRAFIEEMQPDEAQRRTLQQFSGIGLLGTSAQFVMFHYGLGANGKSVFLETLIRILGPGLAVGLPRESIVGGSERSSGSASPDLVRLYGKRMVRILEVKGDVPLQEDLIKRLTGGEAFPVRTLFKGYFEFQSFATAHMSGNAFPTIDGTDNGIWRRMLLMHWEKTIPEERRRDFEEVVSEFVREEGPGILAWLVEGALDYLANGLVVADSVRNATASYREEMDPIGDFLAACVRRVDGVRVQANDLYQAYVSWSMANAKRARTVTKFGRVLSQSFKKVMISGRQFYEDVELHDVPMRPDDARNPSAHDDFPR